MVPHFIEVHNVTSNYPLSVNLDNITKIDEDGLSDMSEKWGIISLVRGNDISTKESYDDIKDLIRKAGCQITKADPRLEVTPILWDDLVKLEMLGQPVWNSNSRKWMLVLDSAGPYTHDWIVLLNDAGAQERWNEHDVQARPLYRMRKEI